SLYHVRGNGPVTAVKFLEVRDGFTAFEIHFFPDAIVRTAALGHRSTGYARPKPFQHVAVFYRKDGLAVMGGLTGIDEPFPVENPFIGQQEHPAFLRTA